NTIPVRICFEEKMKFYRLLQKVQEEALASEPYHHHPLVEIQSGSALKQNLIDHILVFENYPIGEQIEGYGREGNKSNKSELKLTNVEIFEQTNYDFNVLLAGSDRLRIRFLYNGNVYDGDFVERVAKHFSIAVDQVIVNQELEAGELTLLSEEEKNRLLYEFNDTEADYPDNMTIHRLFEEQVERTPNYIAVIGQSVRMKHWQSLTDADVSSTPFIQLSYRELNEMSNRLTYQLREKGVGPDNAVGLMVERSVEMIIGMLAIMKAGGAYLPIDSEYPGERKRYMLEDGKVRWLLVSDDIEDIGDEIISQLEVIDLRQEEIYRRRSGNLEYIGSGSSLLYVIYTSGSTGKPKGVMLEHRNLVNLIHYQYKYTDIDFNRVLQFTTISFDVSAQEIFSAFLSGGQLYLLNKETRTDIPELFRLIERNGIKTVFLPVSFLKAIFREDEYINLIPQCIGHITTAGEQVVISNNFREYLKEKKVHLHNHYGPSETHVVTTLTIDPGGDIPELPSIGKPVMNTGIYIVDKWENLSPGGAAGEILIGGVQVGRGYLNNPELTAEKFISAPASSRKPQPGGTKKRTGKKETPYSPTHQLTHSTIYRTGDLGRWLSDGNIEFLGRIDHQVKIRGFRVEPGEIESRLLNYPGIKEVVVLLQEEERGDKYLCAYVVADGENVISELRECLSKELPDYMIPSYFMQLEKIPLTPNGKVNRKELPKPELKAGEGYTAPRDEIERKLVEIWSKVLGREELHASQLQTSIGIDDNFFQLGGHSLTATTLAARIHQELDVEISLREIFTTPTIKGIAELVKVINWTDAKNPGRVANQEREVIKL
ncbi:MAG: amino acid adenylation domain-containing protein, partial [Candidatus Aminicenantes bacterium]